MSKPKNVTLSEVISSITQTKVELNCARNEDEWAATISRLERLAGWLLEACGETTAKGFAKARGR